MLTFVIFIIAIALLFDIINGFHDAANSVATIVSTRVLSPSVAVFWAAFFNFVAMFVFAPKVANTISKILIIDSTDAAFIFVVLAGLLGAIVWDLITWWFGIPTSSSHALIGGLTGAGLAYKGTEIINWGKIIQTATFIPLAPVIGLMTGFFVMIAIYWIFRKWTPHMVDWLFRKGQFFSAALYSLGHGGNDAQKTMGVIVALLVAAGMFDPDKQLSLASWDTLWIILSCHLAMAIGTALGGWRIVKTLGMKLARLKPVHGFCAESAGAFTIFLATALGIPISTTQTIAGSIAGVSSVSNPKAVRWKFAVQFVYAWILTIPAAALISAFCFWVIKIISALF